MVHGVSSVLVMKDQNIAKHYTCCEDLCLRLTYSVESLKTTGRSWLDVIGLC